MQDQAFTLRQMVSQITSVGGSTRARRIVLSGCKGGVGTTTLAVNLGIALRKQQRRVLLVDANPNRGDIAAICGLRGNGEIDESTVTRCTVEQLSLSGPAGVHVLPRFDAQAGAPGTSARQLMNYLQTADHAFDYIVVDAGCCPMTAEVIWPSADLAMVVATPDNVALTDAYMLIKSISGNGVLANIGFVINRSFHEAVTRDIARRLTETCRRFLQLRVRPVGAGMVPDDPRMVSAAANGRMIVCAFPGSPSALAVTEIAKQMTEMDFADAGLNSLLPA